MKAVQDAGDTNNISRLVGDRHFRSLLESLPEVAIQGYDRNRNVVYWNDASTRLYGYGADEAIGRKLEDLLIPDDVRDKVVADVTAWLHEGQRIPASEMELKDKAGRPVPVFSQHIKLEAESGETLMFCVDVDLSHERQAQQKLEHMIRYDALTQLLSREAFESDLDKRLGECKDNTRLAVIFLDLDRFAEINEAQGYVQGDLLLTLAARRLRRQLRHDDLISRVCSDEFVMAFLCRDVDSEVMPVVKRILHDLGRRFMVGGRKIHVGASLGISLFPDHGTSANELIRAADQANHRAKGMGPGAYMLFDERFHHERVRQHLIADRLQRALNNDELTLHYQPQVTAKSGGIKSLEALLRWYPADGEAISPGEFIPIAEQSRQIDQIGEWVFREACRQQAEWKAAGVSHCRIDINFSGTQVGNKDLFANLEACMRKYELTPDDIGIELTENVLIEASEDTLSALRSLHSRGVHIAIDDFGTGFSSLNYLRLFPLTSIKIDRDFVRGACTEASDRAIVEATALIGHRLGLQVVAEGVETGSELELVRDMGCDLIQGFYYFKPMDSDSITELLSAANA